MGGNKDIMIGIICMYYIVTNGSIHGMNLHYDDVYVFLLGFENLKDPKKGSSFSTRVADLSSDVQG